MFFNPINDMPILFCVCVGEFLRISNNKCFHVIFNFLIFLILFPMLFLVQDINILNVQYFQSVSNIFIPFIYI